MKVKKLVLLAVAFLLSTSILTVQPKRVVAQEMSETF